jgi:glycosyltransferase involved in cell wall biosynthesis
LDSRLDPLVVGTGISVVLLVYNEALIIEHTVRNYFDELDGKVPFEMIVAEDGSTDDTKTVVRRLGRELPLRVYTQVERKGYLNAVKDALRLAERDWVFLVDSDYQFAAIDFWRLVPKMATHDVVLGIKKPRRDPFYRIVLSWGLNFLLRRLFHLPYRDMDTGFRLLRRETVADIGPKVRHFAFFTAEFVVRCQLAGYQIAEVPVIHYSRKEGATNIFYVSKLPMIVLHQLRGIWRLYRELRAQPLTSRLPDGPARPPDRREEPR